jgi:O-antigen/teichoic acid export membrane protein
VGRGARTIRPWLGHAFVSLAAAGLGIQALTLVTGPLVARLLGPQGRGEMVTVTIVSLVCAQGVAGGLRNAIAHFVAASGSAAKDVTRGHLRYWCSLAAPAVVVAAGAAAALLRDSPRAGWLALEAALLTAAQVAQLVISGMLWGEGHLRRMNAFRLIAIAIYLVVVVGLFVSTDRSRATIVLAVYGGTFLVGLAAGWLMLAPATGDRSVQVSVPAMRNYARRSAISGAYAMDAFGIDHLIVSGLLGQAPLGLYAVASSTTNLPTVAVSGVATSLLARMAAAADASHALAVARRWLGATVLMLLGLALPLWFLVGPAIRFAFGSAFDGSVPCARLFVIAWSFLALRRVLMATVQGQGRPGVSSVIEIAGLAVMIAGVSAGATVWGIQGAAAAMAATAALACLALAIAIDWRPASEPVVRAAIRDVDPRDSLV